jgi:tetratricopeptide (TPR) repeat protein
LMDIWPLGRIGFGEAESWKITFHGTSAKRLALEKIPLLLMSVGICIVIIAASQENQSLGTVESLALGQRLINALVAYVAYMGKLMWPGEMSVLYLLNDSLALWEAIAAAMVLLLISGWAVSVIRKHPFFFVGWFWFVGALVPVIGLVQVGKQFIADRYTYIPSIGFFIVLAWGAPVIARKIHLKPALLIGPAIASLAMCILFTGAQIPHWKNSQALFRHALEIDENNYVAHNNLGIALAEEGETEAAISHYQTAIGIIPEFANAYYNMALARIGQERPDLAVALFSRAIGIRPDYVDAWNNLGNTYFAMGQLDQAISHYQTALKLEPGHEFIRRNLEMAEEERKNFRVR